MCPSNDCRSSIARPSPSLKLKLRPGRIIPTRTGNADSNPPLNVDTMTVVLVDCGNTNAVVMATLPVLHARGVNSLPRLALTHGDLKHIGGTQRLCNSIRVDEVVTSPVRFRSPTYRRILRELPDRPESWISVKRGDTLGAWQVLHPAAEDKFPQADDAALVLRTEFEGTRLLLLSDLGRPGQDQLMEREPDLRADVVVAGLPEKGEPLCDALIEKIKPGLIVVVDADFPATRRAPGKLRRRLAGHAAGCEDFWCC